MGQREAQIPSPYTTNLIQLGNCSASPHEDNAMTDEQFQMILSELRKQTQAIEAQTQAIQSQTQATQALQVSPDYSYPFSAFDGFDWSSIGATVVSRDQYGASVVQWAGRQYIRRSKSTYGKEFWFSVSVDGEYKRLITFGKTAEVEPLSNKTVDELERARETASQPTPKNVATLKPTPDKQATFRAVCAALGIGADAVKRCYGEALQALKLPRTKCNDLADAQFSAVCDRVLIDWAIQTQVFSSEGDAISTLNTLKENLQNRYSPLELAQHWATFAPSMSA